MPRFSILAVIAGLALLAGCASSPAPRDPQAEFMAQLNARCGQAFAGKVVASEPAGADADMAGKVLVMHLRRCSAERVEIPFHVGEDRSRTWIITRTAAGLRLKHDHRHADGTSDPVTMYGGDTSDSGTAGQQSFPVDAESVANFRANGLARSVTNVWTVEVSAANAAAPRFGYELRRPAGPNARLFRVEFDLSQPVPAPPTPWGW
jgi:outer membrane murein-binding lipoprotein Lpp